jgi:hypothetical protein
MTVRGNQNKAFGIDDLGATSAQAIKFNGASNNNNNNININNDNPKKDLNYNNHHHQKINQSVWPLNHQQQQEQQQQQQSPSPSSPIQLSSSPPFKQTGIPLAENRKETGDMQSNHHQQKSIVHLKDKSEERFKDPAHDAYNDDIVAHNVERMKEVIVLANIKVLYMMIKYNYFVECTDNCNKHS